jgi:hypothetical protein
MKSLAGTAAAFWAGGALADAQDAEGHLRLVDTVPPGGNGPS